MKWLRLELMAFGPFTDEVLDFSAQPEGVHLVYGPNEAGKSSSLRALRYFLYGFPRNSTDDQLHAARQLRIGGQLEDSQGIVHHWIRRKGGKGSLRLADDRRHADPGEMSRLLGGIDEQQFQLRFGLHYEELVQGGKAISSGEGELGKLLFAAASGLADLGQIQQQLEGEADLLFRPKGRTLAINQTLDEIAAAQKRVQELALATDTWQRCERELTDAQRERDTCIDEIRELAVSSRQIESQLESGKLLPKRSAWLARLKELSDVPTLDDSWCERRRLAETEAIKLQQQFQQLQGWLDDVQRQIDDFDVNPRELQTLQRLRPQLEQRSAITQRRQQVETARHRQALLSDAIDQQLAELGRHLDVDDYRDWQPLTLETQQRLATLVTRYQELSAQRSSLESAAETAEPMLAAVRRELAKIQPPAAEEPLAERLELAVDQSELDAQIDAAQESMAELAVRLDQSLDGLSRWTGDRESLFAQPWPADSQIESCRRTWESQRQQQLDGEQRRDALHAELDQQRAQLQQIAADADLPVANDLQRLRQQRDRLWQDELQPVLRDPSSAADIRAVWMVHGREYEELVAQVDELADRLLQASADLERRRLGLEAVQRGEQALAEIETELDGLKHSWDVLQQEWQAEWPASLQPLGQPAEMQAWLEEVSAIRDNHLQHQQLIAAQERRLASRRHWIDQLKTGLDQCGCSRKADDGDCLKAWIRLGRNHLEALRHQRQQWERLVADQDRLEKELQLRADELSRVEQAVDDWTSQWQEAIQPLGADQTFLPATALPMVQTLMDVQQNINEWSRLDREIRTSDVDEQAIWAAVRDCYAELETPVPDTDLVVVLKHLDQRHEELQRAATRKEDLELQLEGFLTQRGQLNQRQDAVDVECRWLCQQARVDSLDALAEVQAAWESRRDVLVQLQAVEQQLRERAGEVPLETFVSQLQQLTEEELQWRLTQNQQQVEELNQQRDQWNQRVGALADELRKMDGNDLASQAQEEVESRKAVLAQQIDRYCRLNVATQMLRTTIQSYREKHQGPILEHASRFFQQLTCDSYQGLTTDLDERGQMILLGQRGDGRPVLIAHMSEGTRDQLYLALRLASLKDHLAHHAPLPFVVDDILIKFDDRRSLATLEVLAEIGQQTQVILFTHHAHLIELARNELPGGLFQVHELRGQGTSPVDSTLVD